MQLLKAIFIKPHGTFLKSILKDQDLSYADIEGFIKAINEDLQILLPQMTQVNRMIASNRSNRTSSTKWYECRITLTHLIDCMIQVLPVIQAALNDCINKACLDVDRKSVSRRTVKLNQFRLDPKKIIQKMEQLTDKTDDESKDTQLKILSEAANLFSSMILICNGWLKAMIAAELGL